MIIAFYSLFFIYFILIPLHSIPVAIKENEYKKDNCFFMPHRR